MYLICVDNGGFEDMLTEGSSYKVEEFGDNSYKVYDDKEVPRWFGTFKFQIVLQE